MRPARRASGPGLHGQAHGPGHGHRVVGPVDRRGHEHAVAAELHGQRGVGSGADAGIEDHRDLDRLAEQRDVVRVADAQPAADRVNPAA